jgi:ribosomal-protein-alanine N-acetyltransferase
MAGEAPDDVSTGHGSLPSGMRVERMQVERDLDGVMAVEHACFMNPTSRQTLEWEARHSDVSRVYVLRFGGEAIIGFCAVWVIFDELHINNLAVLPEWRGRGLGAGLLAAVLDASQEEGARRATLEVRASNEAARTLYARFGFVQAGVRRGYYTNPPEDALILWLDLSSPEPCAGSSSA